MLRKGLIFLLLAGLSAASGSLMAQDATRTEAQLKQLRAEIERVRAQVSQDAAERDRLARSLREAERSAGAARNQLDRVRGEREERERRRAMLARQRAERERALASERTTLAAQLRAAYMIGKREPIEMFLNQRDPAEAGRMLSYYGYFGRARAAQIAVIQGHLQDIADLDAQLETEQERLVRLEAERKAEVSRLDQARLERGQVVAVSPTIGDIHQVANAFDDRVSISIHVYGGNIGAVRRAVYDADTGVEKPFVSGYSNAFLPNVWDRSAEVRAALTQA